MINSSSLDAVLRLWNLYKSGEAFPHGLTRWRELFSHLRDVRLWDQTDRIRETGILDIWQNLLNSTSPARFEVELWYRRGELNRQQSESLKHILDSLQGTVISEFLSPEIEYHGALIELPASQVSALVDQASPLLYLSAVRQLWPMATASLSMDTENEVASEEVALLYDETSASRRPYPIAALLDGLPLENHKRLSGRLIVDDPDDYASTYDVSGRVHGTGMASLIIFGELDTYGPPLATPLYVRPIFRTSLDFNERPIEEYPTDVLITDLIHRSIRRMFVGDGQEDPVAPNVKVINLSIGDESRPFLRQVSPLARMLDWLSFSFNVLIVVSSGNATQNIAIPVDAPLFRTLNQQDQASQIVQLLHQESWDRRILSPSESINALTIGALHDDNSHVDETVSSFDYFPKGLFPSPISRFGSGFKGSIKPELLLPGGRQRFTSYGTYQPGATILRISEGYRSPGHRVAGPGRFPSELDATRYLRGTSNAAALATRFAARLHNVLENLSDENGNPTIPDRYYAVLLKALVAHGASQRSVGEAIRVALNLNTSSSSRKVIADLVGYGIPNSERVTSCSDCRATVIGFDSISMNEQHEFLFPLPPCLASIHIWRRLTITLAWLSPTNPRHRSYRQAELTVAPPGTQHGFVRIESDHWDVLRGTLQHEILDGRRAQPYVDGEGLKLVVACQEDAGQLSGEVLYGLAVSLEVRPETNMPIYDEVQSRIRSSAQIYTL